MDYIWEVLKQGAFIEFDNFGKEFTCEPGGFADGSFIKDTQRVKLAAGILKSSYASQLLITNDICLKCMLRSRGFCLYRYWGNLTLPISGNQQAADDDDKGKQSHIHAAKAASPNSPWMFLAHVEWPCS